MTSALYFELQPGWSGHGLTTFTCEQTQGEILIQPVYSHRMGYEANAGVPSIGAQSQQLQWLCDCSDFNDRWKLIEQYAILQQNRYASDQDGHLILRDYSNRYSSTISTLFGRSVLSSAATGFGFNDCFLAFKVFFESAPEINYSTGRMQFVLRELPS